MRRVLRIFQIIVVSLVVLIAALLLSIPLDGLLGSGRVTALTNTELPGPDGPLRAYVARPPTPGPHPAVIMIHEWWGLQPDVVEKADALAAQGFVVIAPDTFRGSSTGWIPRAIYQVSTAPADRVNQDLDAAFAWLTAQPDVDAARVAVVGFCYGGRASLLYTIHNPAIAATAVFYGMTEPTAEQLARIRGPVLGIWGGADQSIPLTEVARLERDLIAAGVPTAFHVFDGQPHAFVGGIEQIRAGGAAGEAWQLLESFLDDALSSSSDVATPSAAVHADPAAVSTSLLGSLHHYFVCTLAS